MLDVTLFSISSCISKRNTCKKYKTSSTDENSEMQLKAPEEANTVSLFPLKRRVRKLIIFIYACFKRRHCKTFPVGVNLRTSSGVSMHPKWLSDGQTTNPTPTGQLCQGEKVSRVWTSISSFHFSYDYFCYFSRVKPSATLRLPGETVQKRLLLSPYLNFSSRLRMWPLRRADTFAFRRGRTILPMVCLFKQVI